MEYEPQVDNGDSEAEAQAAQAEAEIMQYICENKSQQLFNALKETRQEPGISIHEVAVSIRSNFDTAEIGELIRELTD